MAVSRLTGTRLGSALTAAILLIGSSAVACGSRAPQAAPPMPSVIGDATASPPTITPVPAESPSPEGPVVPNVVGMRLPEGEAALQARGFMSVSLVDATGQGRMILERANWVIRTQDPPGGSPATPGLAITLGVAKATDGQPPISSEPGVVPNVACLDLQSAQDALRDAGFYLLVAKDGLGQGRIPLLDRNWIVVGQSAAPRTSPDPTQLIELTVVKYGEPTGNSGCRS